MTTRSYTDIFEDWKENKFIIVKNLDEFENNVILTNVKYWNDNYDELCLWCKQYNCEVVGMTVDIPDEKTLMLFVLRWS